MRSKLVFDAVRVVSNRFVLTNGASKATRRLHRGNTRIQDTVNEVLAYVSRRNRNEIAPFLSNPTTPNHLMLQASRSANNELTTVCVASSGHSRIVLYLDEVRRTALAISRESL
jgi:hypothetical protein